LKRLDEVYVAAFSGPSRVLGSKGTNELRKKKSKGGVGEFETVLVAILVQIGKRHS